MIDAGPQFSDRPGRCVKNTFAYQRDLDRFTYMIQGFLHPLSVPPGAGVIGYEVNPIAWRPPGAPYDPWKYSDRGSINPCQDPAKNLGGESVAFAVGGMMQHWTAATPRHHPKLEQYHFEGLDDAGNEERWDELYREAEALLHTKSDVFDKKPKWIRTKLVREALTKYYNSADIDPELRPPKAYPVQNLPMAVSRSDDERNAEFLFYFYTGTDTMLEEVIDNSELSEYLEIRPEHRVPHCQSTEGSTVPCGAITPARKFASLHILTRRASEGSEALPSLARRVSTSFFGARVIPRWARNLQKLTIFFLALQCDRDKLSLRAYWWRQPWRRSRYVPPSRCIKVGFWEGVYHDISSGCCATDESRGCESENLRRSHCRFGGCRLDHRKRAESPG